MTPEHISIVTKSFTRLFPIKAKLSQDFYDELFGLAPDLRDLFPEDMTQQREKLVDTLAWVVRNLGITEALAETVPALARRHVGYGAKPEHYAQVGQALILALERNTPGGMTDAEIGAWTAAIEALADMMIAAAYPPQELQPTDTAPRQAS